MGGYVWVWVGVRVCLYVYLASETVKSSSDTGSGPVMGCTRGVILTL